MPEAGAPAGVRNPGLDTLRALAILLVFAYHYRVFVSHEPTFGLASAIGWTGVDLFFVLSGYLIGHQLLSGLRRGEALSLPRFYLRRALRTWPAFWAMLAFYFLLPAYMDGKPGPELWRFLSFTQNFQLQPGTAFSHAWSLCIEEQFYLVLPLIVLLGLQLRAPRWTAWLLIASLMLLAILARSLLWQRHGLEADAAGYYPNIYYATLCRFDEFLPGVAVALLRHFHPQAWQRLMARGRVLLLGGVLAVAAMFQALNRWYYIDGYGYSFALTAFGYPLLAIAFALLLCAALSPCSPLQRWRLPGAYPLALASYSIYLSHKPIAHALAKLLEPYALSAWQLAACVSAACLGGGALLYWSVERPFLRLRERWQRDRVLQSRTEASPA